MYTYRHPHPAVTTDIAVFTIRDGALACLLIRRGARPYKGRWALPGGFVRIDESLDAAAARELQEETGASDVYLEQLYTFGAPRRDPRERVITVAYFALVPAEQLSLQAASDADAVGWFALDSLPALAFDHADILAVAQRRLTAKLDYSTIAFQFLPVKFTLSDLHSVYEIVRREPLDKRNFRRWVLALGLVEETDEYRRDGVMRPARLYTARDRDTVAIIK